MCSTESLFFRPKNYLKVDEIKLPAKHWNPKCPCVFIRCGLEHKDDICVTRHRCTKMALKKTGTIRALLLNIIPF